MNVLTAHIVVYILNSQICPVFATQILRNWETVNVPRIYAQLKINETFEIFDSFSALF